MKTPAVLARPGVRLGLMGASTFLASWLATATTRYVVAQSYLTLAFDLGLSGLWLAGLYAFDDWKDIRRMAPAIIVADVAGTALGLTVP